VRARAEREVASRYEAKLGEIEASMRELVAQNSALKAELARVRVRVRARARVRARVPNPNPNPNQADQPGGVGHRDEAHPAARLAVLQRLRRQVHVRVRALQPGRPALG